jgi:hypothetical protein
VNIIDGKALNWKRSWTISSDTVPKSASKDLEELRKGSKWLVSRWRFELRISGIRSNNVNPIFGIAS